MKYTVPSWKTAKSSAATKKFGFFASEEEFVKWIWLETGLTEGQRHPLTWLMEACDDTAYCIFDVEDAIKKDLVSPEDLRAFVSNKFLLSTEGGGLTNQINNDFTKADNTGADLARVREIKTSYLRTRLVETLITGAANEFLRDKNSIHNYTRTMPLLECGSFPSKLTSALKQFARTHAYNSPAVLKVELQGATVINHLMDLIWDGITKRKSFHEPGAMRVTPEAAFVYSKISSSYRWHFENPDNNRLPIRYREMQLLTDVISGMTDRFAVELCAELQRATHG